MLGIKPIFYLDDADEKIGRYLNGIPILGTVDSLEKWVDRYAITKVIIAFPSASSKRIRSVAEAARSIGLAVDGVPALTDLVAVVLQLRKYAL